MNFKRSAIFLTLLSSLFVLSSLVQAKDYIPVNWDQLIPAGYDLAELQNDLISQYDTDNMDADSLTYTILLEQLQLLQDNAPMTKEYDNTPVKLPGFIVPLDFSDAKINRFLLVPYYGACIHTPAPPPNQIVYVILEEGIKLDNTYEPVYINGLMKVENQNSEMGLAGYTIYGDSVEPYVVN